MIGSEIDPYHLGDWDNGKTGNGNQVEKSFYLIVQDGKPIVIETIDDSQYYGYSWQQGDKTYNAYSLAQFPINLFK